jgi:hypothetical protein
MLVCQTICNITQPTSAVTFQQQQQQQILRMEVTAVEVNGSVQHVYTAFLTVSFHVLSIHIYKVLQEYAYVSFQ